MPEPLNIEAWFAKPEIQHLLKKPDVQKALAVTRKAGLSDFAILHNIFRESRGNNENVGDGGHSFGLFQVNTEDGLLRHYRLEHGKVAAITAAKNPAKAAAVMVSEAKIRKVTTETDPRMQCWYFCQKIENPAKEVKKAVHLELFGTEWNEE